MIVQELHRYYERLVKDPDCDVPARFWGKEKVGWRLILDRDGMLVGADPLMTDDGKKTRDFKVIRVPEHQTRSGSGFLPFFLCDNVAYLLGYDEAKGVGKRQASAELHREVLKECCDEGALAVLRFFDRDDFDAHLPEGTAEKLHEAQGFVAFGLEGQRGFVHERPEVAQAWMRHSARPNPDAVWGHCSITGEHAPLARLFPQVTGVPGAQSAGASLVSFNLDAFESYGKRQSYNASLSEEVASNAGAALRYLYGSLDHRVRFGDTMVLFWTDRPAEKENAAVGIVFGGVSIPDVPASERAEESEEVQQLRKTLENIRSGRPVEEYDLETRFYLLGISPNAARLAVRFFEVETFGRILENYDQYLQDVAMDGVRTTSLRVLLQQTAQLGKEENIPSTLVNGCFASMLTGCAFPSALFHLLLSRTRSDQAGNDKFDLGKRAALLKACLVRKDRIMGREERGLSMSLNRDRTDQGYVLGRLFAVIERAQGAAIGDVNASVRDRYIGGAATTPARVMPHLLLNMQNHLAKIRKANSGLCNFLEKNAEEIMDLLNDDVSFPRSLSSEQQGEFIVGYYQQRADLWKKKSKDNPPADETVDQNGNLEEE